MKIHSIESNSFQIVDGYSRAKNLYQDVNGDFFAFSILGVEPEPEPEPEPEQWRSPIPLYTAAKTFTSANKHGIMGMLTLKENTDLAVLAEGNRLRPDVLLEVEVTLSDAAKHPTKFELCRENNRDGFIVTFSPPAGGWRVGRQISTLFP